ncbi:MAG: MBL fold metallo-hydrolase [Bacteroidota bacterium]|nr:MBL fold metallo-hydrolase [Bacteroidota bacterium]
MSFRDRIQFTVIGGGQEIGANCFYLNMDGTGIILDSGLHPEKNGSEALPKFELLENLTADFVLISHSHTDHIGALPYLIQKNPHLKIYTTPQTRDLAEVMLHNSLALTQKEIVDSDPLPKYTHEQVDLLTESFNILKYNESLPIQGYRHFSNQDIQVTFLDAGHILGAAGILIQTNDIRVFYTGDTNVSKQSILASADYPDEPIDVLILECTSGATGSLAKRSEEAKRLAKSVNKIIDKGGSILIPIFALGKFQETITLLHTMMRKGSIPHIDIYTSGMAREISDVYDLHRFNTKRINNVFKINEIPQLPIIQDEFLTGKYFKTPSIVLASSGMMFEGTTSFALAQRWLKEKNFGIFFVGYVAPDSPGYTVLNSKLGDIIKLTEISEVIKVACDVDYFRLTSHSNRDDLISVVKKLKPKIVILVHGEKKGIDWMEKELLNHFPSINIIKPKIGENYPIKIIEHG